MGLFKKRDKQAKYKTTVTYYNPPGQHLHIIADSLDIMKETKNPETYFSRYKLAEESALYCEDLDVPVWNGMTPRRIYELLSEPETRDVIHRKFIDRLFEAGKENNLVYQMYDCGYKFSEDNIKYVVKKLNGKKFRFCKVGNANSYKPKTYVTKDRSVKVGDSITVPVGNGFVPNTKLKQVVEVFDAPLDSLDFPIQELRCVESKLKNVICPHCGASIEIDVGQKVGKCTRCQSEFYLMS